jgi:hypothetical protein
MIDHAMATVASTTTGAAKFGRTWQKRRRFFPSQVWGIAAEHSHRTGRD